MDNEVCVIKLSGVGNYAVVSRGRIMFGLDASERELATLIFEEKAITQAQMEKTGTDSDDKIKGVSISLIPTFDCNLRCLYCYARGGDTQEYMSFEQARVAIDAISKSGEFDLLNLYLVGGGEPFTEKQRHYIQDQLNVTLLDQYGLCEINTGLAGECWAQEGLHILADHAYPEIINPKNGQPCNEGEEGELVLTTLDKQASPLIRYKTGDIASLTYAPCTCGRTTPRIDRIKKRTTNTIFYKGIKIEREFIEKIMEDLREYINPYLWTFDISGETSTQEIGIKVLPQENTKVEEVIAKVKQVIQNEAGIKVEVLVVSPDERLRLEQGKLNHFVDHRNDNP